MFRLDEKIVISGEFPEYIEVLQKLGLECITTEVDERLARPVAFHPDMQMFRYKKHVITFNRSLKEKLSKQGLDVNTTALEPKEEYPFDVICNATVIGNHLFCNEDYIDESVRSLAKAHRLEIVNVNQGYTACSILSMNNRSLITADKGIADAAREVGLDVLKVISGGIRLDGYDTGFIGGCGGQVGNAIILTGKVESHPDGKKIKQFINNQCLELIELTKNDLHDFGGVIEIK